MDARSAAARPKVLIVEPDRVLASALLKACLDKGLEPKICLGSEWNGHDCPGLRGESCPRAATVAATFISVVSPESKAAFPYCVGGRVILSADRRTAKEMAGWGPPPDALIGYPYMPEVAAEMLLQVIREERKERLWDEIRSTRS